MIKEWTTNWDFWSTVITAFAAVSGIWGVRHEVKNNNKQFLLDRCLHAYFLLQQLTDTFVKNEKSLTEFNGYNANYRFNLMCNNAYLESIQGATT